MKPLRLAPLLLLAGCGLFGPSRPDPEAETRPQYLACQREAESSPEVRALAGRGQVDNGLNATRTEPLRRQALARAYRDCLRRNGLALPGGVEPVVRR